MLIYIFGRKNKMSIDRLLRETEAVPLGTEVLGKMAGKGHKTRVIMYDKVEQADKLEEIVNQEHPYAILLIMDKRTPDSKVGHYCCVFLQGGGGEKGEKNTVNWFDPYGNKLNKLMQLTRNKNNLMRLVRESGKKLVMNTKHFQKMSDKISTCGRWCAVRLRFADWSNEKFWRFMQSKKLKPDEIVTMLTMVYASGKHGNYDGLSGAHLEHLLK